MGFVDHVLKPNDGNGLFGRCTGYYGTVEAQGKGTLHLHLLVWLDGNLNPQALRDAMTIHPDFKDRLITWLESIISCETLGTEEVVTLDSPKKPIRPSNSPHPGAVYPPQQRDFIDKDAFAKAFRNFAKDLAVECNWHTHSDTCWKNLKPHEPRDDDHCRMRVDGTTRALTEIDPETGSILLRRLHPWINNFNDVVIFLMQCNMDIKFIGSGEAAKALTYYVTDYITKTSLPVHVGLAAVSYAIRQNGLKFAKDPDAPGSVRDKSLVTKSVQAMMARQETSHQQVMSYLVGGGDHYTGHEFRSLRWGAFDRYVRTHFRTATPDEALDDKDWKAPLEHDVYLTLKNQAVATVNQVEDYTSRPKHDTFEDLCLWDFVACTEKISSEGDRRIGSHLESDVIRRGPKPLPRGHFSNPAHVQFSTHKVRMRRSEFVPVLLGPTIPRRDKDDVSAEVWCRAMLILFKPWFSPNDLRRPGQTWTDAFAKHKFPPHLVHIMNNMNIQHECKDARDTYNPLRRSGAACEPLLATFPESVMRDDEEDGMALESALLDDDTLDDDDDDFEFGGDDPATVRGSKSDVPPEIEKYVDLLASKTRSATITIIPDQPDSLRFAESTREDTDTV